jgi:hypothetical protein
MRYTFSDEDEDEDTDDTSTRKSTHNSGVSTPAEHSGPTVTASGRQVKSRLGGMYGETMLVDQRKELENERAATNANGIEEDQDESNGLEQRSSRPRRPIRAPRRIDDSSEEVNGASDGESSGQDWSGNEEEPDAEEFEAGGEDEDEEMSANDSEMNDGRTAPLQEGTQRLETGRSAH